MCSVQAHFAGATACDTTGRTGAADVEGGTSAAAAIEGEVATVCGTMPAHIACSKNILSILASKYPKVFKNKSLHIKFENRITVLRDVKQDKLIGTKKQ